MFGEGQTGSGGLAWDRGDGSLGGGVDQRFGKQETRKVFVFVIGTSLQRESEI